MLEVFLKDLPWAFMLLQIKARRLQSHVPTFRLVSLPQTRITCLWSARNASNGNDGHGIPFQRESEPWEWRCNAIIQFGNRPFSKSTEGGF